MTDYYIVLFPGVFEKQSAPSRTRTGTYKHVVGSESVQVSCMRLCTRDFKQRLDTVKGETGRSKKSYRRYCVVVVVLVLGVILILVV